MMRPGAAFDYKVVVEEAIDSKRVMLDERS